MVAPARTAKDGTEVPASFRSVTQQKIVQDRRDVWFQTPCDDQMTVGFIASLQRALKARGLYRAPITGVMDRTTAEAVRQYQAARGLDSPVLSLAAARDLGIAAADLSTL
jgi:peptidoglycan hydrolase-like protein with peptidoglycan-binding domain